MLIKLTLVLLQQIVLNFENCKNTFSINTVTVRNDTFVRPELLLFCSVLCVVYSWQIFWQLSCNDFALEMLLHNDDDSLKHVRPTSNLQMSLTRSLSMVKINEKSWDIQTHGWRGKRTDGFRRERESQCQREREKEKKRGGMHF